jgi:hypothetical protein
MRGFNEAAANLPRNCGRSGFGLGLIASMRPRRICRGIQIYTHAACQVPRASMRPRRICRGIMRVPSGSFGLWHASMRPRRICRGISPWTTRRSAKLDGDVRERSGVFVTSIFTAIQTFSRLICKILIIREHPRCEHCPAFASPLQRSRRHGRFYTITGSRLTGSNTFPRLVTCGSTSSAGPRSRHST